MYGAIETQASPWTVKRWKRIGHEAESSMRVTRLDTHTLAFPLQEPLTGCIEGKDLLVSSVRYLSLAAEFLEANGLVAQSSTQWSDAQARIFADVVTVSKPYVLLAMGWAIGKTYR